MPFKLNHDRRHHIPKQKRKVTNWRDYDASLRQRGSLTVWFTAEAIAGWQAAPRTTPGVFGLALRQAEGLIGSVIGLLGLALRVPDHSTLSRRAATLEVPRPTRPSSGAGAGSEGEPMHLLVDSTGLKLCGAGEWLIEKHGSHARRSWRKLHIGLDAGTGEIVAAALTDRDVDDASQVGPLLDQVAGVVASFIADGAYDQTSTYTDVARRYPDAAVVVPPRATAVPSETAASAPTQRDCHLQCIAEHGRRGWQKRSGYNTRARAEAAIARWKQVIGDELRSRKDERRVAEVEVAVHALNGVTARKCASCTLDLNKAGLTVRFSVRQSSCPLSRLKLRMTDREGVAAKPWNSGHFLLAYIKSTFVQ